MEEKKLFNVHVDYINSAGSCANEVKMEIPPEAKYHHTASAQGYVSRRGDPIITLYVGRFGRGYKVHRPRFDTTQYHFVDYYIIPDEA